MNIDFVNADPESAQDTIRSALECAHNVLFLLSDEVEALGHRAGQVRAKVQHAIELTNAEVTE
jgi:hypothetical protein